jgi:hypothetical protein
MDTKISGFYINTSEDININYTIRLANDKTTADPNFIDIDRIKGITFTLDGSCEPIVELYDKTMQENCCIKPIKKKCKKCKKKHLKR